MSCCFSFTSRALSETNETRLHPRASPFSSANITILLTTRCVRLFEVRNSQFQFFLSVSKMAALQLPWKASMQQAAQLEMVWTVRIKENISIWYPLGIFETFGIFPRSAYVSQIVCHSYTIWRSCHSPKSGDLRNSLSCRCFSFALFLSMLPLVC